MKIINATNYLEGQPGHNAKYNRPMTKTEIKKMAQDKLLDAMTSACEDCGQFEGMSSDDVKALRTAMYDITDKFFDKWQPGAYAVRFGMEK
jgi:hypothetical protein